MSDLGEIAQSAFRTGLAKAYGMREDQVVFAIEEKAAFQSVVEALEAAVREQVARELLAAGADPYQNLAWMYSEQAATIARRGSLAPAESSVSGAKAVDQ